MSASHRERLHAQHAFIESKLDVMIRVTSRNLETARTVRRKLRRCFRSADVALTKNNESVTLAALADYEIALGECEFVGAPEIERLLAEGPKQP